MDRFPFGVYQVKKTLDKMHYDLFPFYLKNDYQDTKTTLSADNSNEKLPQHRKLRKKIKQFIKSNTKIPFAADFKRNILYINKGESGLKIKNMNEIFDIVFYGSKSEVKEIPDHILKMLRYCVTNKLFSKQQMKYFTRYVLRSIK